MSIMASWNADSTTGVDDNVNISFYLIIISNGCCTPPVDNPHPWMDVLIRG